MAYSLFEIKKVWHRFDGSAIDILLLHALWLFIDKIKINRDIF
ncbi:hypothetical protein Xkoz_01269 [Xenorhabdus kozodoii]|uniref:Uncharacterized protein n=1 Tax=Xenorhabdus kozodoii TaxID=351676 RepID=A0A2D0LEI0_9GAMM|nr:hypothetical protein Xkoz_01269 [Xenorhabdus kozodoii]